MANFAEHIISFYHSLEPPAKIPKGFEFLYPQKDKEVMKVVKEFFFKFYDDNEKRTLLFGINPGRFGAGTTGVNFTAPRQLKEHCGINHPFKNQSELSAEFIYEMIEAYGGAEKFYKKFFITSVCPLGFIKNGINVNYYDDKRLLKAVMPFILLSIKQQLKLNVNRDIAFIIGGDKNLKFFQKLNDEHRLFSRIIALPHPRFIMQYRRKTKHEFVSYYMDNLRQA